MSAYAADQCLIYAVNDRGLNNSQLVSSDPYQNYKVSPVGPEYSGADIEAVDFTYSKTLDGLRLYGAAGDNTAAPYEAGHLYFLDHNTGEIIKDVGQICIGTICGFEVSAISFRHPNNTLWGWAEDCGLVTIDTNTAQATLRFRSLFGTCNPNSGKKVGSSNDVSKPGGIEDITWSNDGEVLYAALTCSSANDRGLTDCPEGGRTDVYAYEPKASNYCLVTSLEGQYEAMETLPDGNILLGQHRNSIMKFTSLAIDENDKCSAEVIFHEPSVDTSPFDDLEGIAWSCPDCIEMPGEWEYVADAFDDSTQASTRKHGSTEWTDPRANEDGIVIGDTDFEIFGMAMKQDRDTVYVAFNANMPIEGIFDKRADDGHIGWGDVIFNFGGNNYGIHFAANQAGVPSIGLYKDINTVDVTTQNYGWSSLQRYRRYLAEEGVTASLGDLDDSPGAGFANMTYFSQTDHNIPMVISEGTEVEGANVEILDADALADMGLDFESNIPDSSGKYTIGFKFDRTEDMVGEFTAHVFIECINDGMAFIGDLKPRQCEDTMSEEAPR
jgi:hypothetical protein